MAKTIIHVNQHHIKSNQNGGTNKPVFTVKKAGSNTYTNRVYLTGPSQLVYSDDGTCERGKLSCGAKCWIETEDEVVCINPIKFSEIL